VDPATELRAHDPLTFGREQDHQDRLLNIVFLASQRNTPARVDTRRKSPTRPQEITHALLL
jgi:hypothetical protein